MDLGNREELHTAAAGPRELVPPSRSLGSAEAWVIVLSALVTVGDWLRAATGPAAVETYDAAVSRGELSEAVVGATDVLGTFVLPWLLAWLAASVWLRAACVNAGVLSGDRFPGTGAGAFWCWVIPVGSRWWPRRLIEQVWRVSRRPGAGPVADAPITAYWWVSWLVYLALYALDGQARLLDWSHSDWSHRPRFDLLVAVASTVALICWINVVHAISVAQEERRRLAVG